MKARKIVSIICTLALTLGLGTTALAASPIVSTEDGSNTDTQIVTANRVGNAADAVYSVDIAWGDMKFTYTETGKKVWDPETHTYKTEDGNPFTGTWAPKTSKAEAEEGTLPSNQVSVTNHSNKDVKIAFSFTKNGGNENGTYTGRFLINGFAIRLGAATENDPSMVSQANTFLNMNGVLAESAAAQTDFELGTATVTIAAVGN